MDRTLFGETNRLQNVTKHEIVFFGCKWSPQKIFLVVSRKFHKVFLSEKNVFAQRFRQQNQCLEQRVGLGMFRFSDPGCFSRFFHELLVVVAIKTKVNGMFCNKARRVLIFLPLQPKFKRKVFCIGFQSGHELFKVKFRCMYVK